MKTNSAIFLSFLANDTVLPLKLDAFCLNPCKHKILNFLEVLTSATLFVKMLRIAHFW